MTLPLLTLTGIDAKTDPTWVKGVLSRFILKNGFSAIEFAILRSPKIDQSPRYPAREVVKRLTSAAHSGDFAFHLCGRYARMVHSLEWSELCDIIDFNMVGRVQVNSAECDEKAMMTLLRFSAHIGKPVIMQWRDDIFPAVPGLHLLQDRSGGKGIEESSWSSPDATCRKSKTVIGYAGGLGPDNVGASLPKIASAAQGKRFWIDCESSLRTNDWFDQAKAEAMAAAVHDAMPQMFREVSP